MAQDCFELAKAHLEGKERLTKNAEQAAALFRRACELDLPDACQEYGEALLVGDAGIALDTAAAMEMLHLACWKHPEGKAGRAIGLFGGRKRCDAIVGLYAAMPPATREDSVNAKPMMMRACQRGKIDAACELMLGAWAAFPDSVPLPDSVKRAIAEEQQRRLRLEQARQDSIRRVEDSVRQEEERRHREVRERQRDEERRAATRTAADARLRVSRDRSCKAGDGASCLELARMFEAGRGGPVDRREAAALRRRACELDPKLCP